MTDIKKHLPAILSCLRPAVSRRDPLETISAALRQLLPASYGITTGRLVNRQEQQSELLDIIIYDTTLPPSQPLADLALIDSAQALLILVLADRLDRSALDACLQRIASAKAIVQATKKTAKKATPSRKLLPLGGLICNELADVRSEDPAELSLLLHRALKGQAEKVRADYVFIQDRQLVYSNPLLNGHEHSATTINIMQEPVLPKPRTCYVCKNLFTQPHFFYRSLCLSCGDLNYLKRIETVDLKGRLALVTGARVKIGYASALRLLRAGAEVLITTRFPHDASGRYSREPDFAVWQDRLHIYGLDFRYLPVLEHFVEHLYTTYPALDILINNAAQTVRRPRDYYAHLVAGEQLSLDALPVAQQTLLKRAHAALPPTPFALAQEQVGLPTLAYPSPTGQPVSRSWLSHTDSIAALPSDINTAHFPPGIYDEHQQQLDLRHRNSWTLAFDEIDLTEFLEVQTINVTAPYLLISRLWPLLQRSAFAQRFIVNVTAVEGQFQQIKNGSHVHTNMAKAALNMLTHTIAAQLAEQAIYVNSVDPGWISQQAPTSLQTREELQKLLPIDLVDAAARICDPVFSCLTTGNPISGQFFKDYQSVPW